jgi:DNA-binding MarR family transcriptional regulator
MFLPSDRLVNLLGALALEATTAQVEAAQAVTGQSGAAAAALVTIAAHPNRTLEQLRAPLELSQPGVTRLVQRLVDAGWVERTGPGGRGGHRLAPTPAGQALLDRLFEARRAALHELLAPLDEDERGGLTSLLERLLDARATDFVSKQHLCRLCERRTCVACPVAGASHADCSDSTLRDS